MFVIKEIKNAEPRTCVLTDLKVEEILRKFYKKEMQKN